MATLADSKPRMAALRRLFAFIAPYWMRLILAFVFLCASAAATLVIPYEFKQILDHGFAAGDSSSSINHHFLELGLVAIVLAATTASRFYSVSWLGERVVADIRGAVYARMLLQSPEFFEVTRTGEVLSRLTADTTLVQTVVGSSLSMGLRSFFLFLGGIAMLAATSAKLFGITIGMLIAVIMPIMLLGRRVRRLSRASQDRIADSSALAGEVLNAMATVQAFTQEAHEAARFRAIVEAGFITALRRTSTRAWLTSIAIALVFGVIVFVLWLGANDVRSGAMSGGDLLAFVFYAALVAGSVAALSESWGDVLRAAGATERLTELIDAPPFIVSPASTQALGPADSRGATIVFDSVGFHYPSRPDTLALSEYSLAIKAGETIALVGPSGAGKSTVFQLLLRFYDPQAGRILLNGVAIGALDLAALRSQIGIVPQDTVIFSGNALENIRYGRPEASEAEVLAAAEAAQAHEFIERLPMAYQTFLGERGVRLSGGQRQRIAIARAILKNPPVLLLDEATSALDAQSEHLVQRALEAAMRNRTTIIIAHRLATVKKADRIAVMDGGLIVELGAHAELVSAGGLYAHLAALQLTV